VFGEDSQVIYIFVALFFFSFSLGGGFVFFFFWAGGEELRGGKAADGHRGGFRKGVGVACQGQ